MASSVLPLTLNSKRAFDVATTSLGTIATFAAESATGKLGQPSSQKEGSLASTLKPLAGGGAINVVKGYKWTLSNILNRDDIPYVRLIEYKCTESSIKRQLEFYAKGIVPDSARNVAGFAISAGEQEILNVYQEIFPKDQPTDFSYWFPYFNETGFDLSTPNWEALDSIGGAIGDITSGFDKMLGNKAGGVIKAGTDLAAAAASTAMNFQYPSVGVADRPRIFLGHNDRTIMISFTLYNTVNDHDWVQNRDLIYVLMSQNLFNKRDYTTGVPPVFYDIYIPGQYYCYAAAMTDIKVKNLGNQRLLYGDFIVPDAYQITLTLSEMVKPSKNQFEAITNGAARKFVNSSTVFADAAAAAEKTAAAEKATARSVTNPNAKIMPAPIKDTAPTASSATNSHAKIYNKK